jgi:RNA recognition motif-containing protein
MDLHITNIAPTVTEIELRALFERTVSVAGIKLLPGGDALVAFDSEADADKALQELDGTVLGGRILSMRRALPRRERSDNIRLRGESAEGPGEEGEDSGK